ncbi:MAG: heme-binding protein [Gloeocapsa sp. UFS-A4-WI-NPMV-4B04]|nr:heme-binding protein [Gloeocapsa sp. UFS-A4-WI-NPMV-4B04]
MDKKRWNLANLILVGSIAISATPALAQSVLNERQISLGLAREAANAAINQCRKDGYQVSVTVVDRSGQVKVMMRDDNSGPHTPDTSRRKAYTALTFRTSTTELANRVASNPSAANLRDITDIILLAGGLPIRAGNEVIGGIGVGGAPGGDRDEVCAKAGIDKISN